MKTLQEEIESAISTYSTPLTKEMAGWAAKAAEKYYASQFKPSTEREQKLSDILREAVDWLQNTPEGRSVPQVNGQPGAWMNKAETALQSLSDLSKE